ncbi:MAG: hypothetical protein FGM24_09050 [Candidatus Kapabacteria bacterium]|nr:hypothetical protein [Candidatus Kapabacteria bacterium]
MESQGPATFTNISFNVGGERNVGCGFWLGLTLIIVGIGLLLDVLGILAFRPVFDVYWPSIIMVGALVQLVTRRRFAGPVFLFIVGALLQADNLGMLQGSFWSAMWALLLVVIGWSITWGMRKKKAIENAFKTMMHGSDNADHTISQKVLFGGSEIRSSSQDFKGGDLRAIAGGIELDLRNAEIRETATIDAVAIMGGIEIRVPPHWRVVTNGSPILGGIENKTIDHRDDNVIAPTLIVNATIIMGGLEIHT